MKNWRGISLLWILITSVSVYGQQTVSPTKYATILYADQVTVKTGNNQLLAAHWVNKGGGTFTWQKEIAEAGIYEINLCYAAKTTGSQVKIKVELDSVLADLGVTAGYYPAGSKDWNMFNCERKRLAGKLHLKKGMNTIVLHLNGKEEINLYALELIPIAKSVLIKKDLANAAKSKPNEKWFTELPYGLMFTWTSQTAPQTGPIKTYEDAVNAFDLGAFVKMVQRTGAAYVMFATTHAEPYFPAPLKLWEKEFPGHTTQRDLIADMADSLAKHDIKLILYLATHTYAKYDKVNDAEFERLNTTLLSEIGERYGPKLAGYWLDGWYQCFSKYPGFDFEKFYKICKTGNEDRIVSFNSWIYPAVTMWQDYFSGEFYTIGNPSSTKISTNGPGTGLQAQNLIVMETDDWLHSPLNTPIKTPSLKAADLTDFIQKQRGKGPVTINIQVYQDGSMSPEALQVMETVKQGLKK